MLTATPPFPERTADGWSWLLGDESRQRLRVRRTLGAALIYLCGALFMGSCLLHGTVTVEEVATVLLYEAAGCVLFYGLIRSGISEAFEDPSLTLYQLLHGLGAIVLSYVLIPPGRSLTLPLLTLTLTFALLSRLTPRQTMLCGLSAAVMMMTAYLFTMQGQRASASFTQEAINLIMGALTLPVFSAVSRQVKEWRDKLATQRTALSASIDALRVLAAKDQLTGLVNRRSMNAAIMEEMLRFKRHQRPFCVALLDVDDFKRVNDRFGHHEGDRVLVAVARHFRKHFSRPDQVARWGGEEFVVLFPETQLEEVLALMEAARLDAVVEVAAGTPDAYKVSWSVGVAQCRVHEDMTELLARADAALYEAKRSGKNRVVEAA